LTAINRTNTESPPAFKCRMLTFIECCSKMMIEFYKSFVGEVFARLDDCGFCYMPLRAIIPGMIGKKPIQLGLRCALAVIKKKGD